MEPTKFDSEKIEHQKKVVICSMYWLIIGAGTILGLKYLLPVAFPFLVAYLIAWILEKPIEKVTKQIPIPRAVVSVFLILLFVFIVGTGLFMLSVTLASWLKDGLVLLPDLMEKGIIPFLASLFDWLEDWFLTLNASVGSVLETTLDGVYKAMKEGTVALVNHLLSLLGSFLSGVPSVLMKTLVTVIASIFISADFDQVHRFVMRVIPNQWHPVLKESRHFFGRILPRFLVSYLLIFLMTFAELSLGLGIAGIPKSTVLAFFIAILDILPVLGTGTVLIPWGVVSLFTGSVHRGIFLLALYAVISVVRNIVEPRLIGKQIQLHPVLTLAGMLTGLHFFGFIGMLGIPLVLAFFRDLNDRGIIHIPFLNDNKPAETDINRKKGEEKHMMNHKGTQILHTERLTLRRFTPEDAQQMYDNWAKDEKVTHYMTWGPHTRVEETREVLEGWYAMYDSPTYYNWGIEFEGKLIGNIKVVRFNETNDCGDLGYCLSRSMWNKGIITEAAQKVMEYLFDEVGIDKVEIRHMKGNPASGKVAQKCGMIYQGTTEQFYTMPDGRKEDSVNYSLTRKEYNARKE